MHVEFKNVYTCRAYSGWEGKTFLGFFFAVNFSRQLGVKD